MYRQSEKNLLNSISPPCTHPHNTANFGPLTAEIGLPVWGTPANFNGFRVLPSLLQQRRSPETIDICTMFGRVSWAGAHTYIFGGSCLLTEFCLVQNLLYVQVLRSPILTALLYDTTAAGVRQTLRRGTRMNYRTFAESATYIRLGGHNFRHRLTF